MDGDLYLSDENPGLCKKDILIVACGTGEHVVRAARAGARVCAVDISSQAVENARMMISANKLDARFVVADACNTGLPDQSFDIIWGSAVLHHLEHERAVAELCRLIRPNGVVLFVSEPTFYNPVLKWAYETAFGRGRNGRRRKFLFFRRRGDDFEKPIERREIELYKNTFFVREVPHGFMFLGKLAHVTSKSASVHNAFRIIDNLILKCFPCLIKYSYEYDFIFSPKNR